MAVERSVINMEISLLRVHGLLETLLTVFTPETKFSFELGVSFERVLQLVDVIS